MSDSLRTVFLTGSIVNFRPFNKADLPTVVRWINNPEVRELISNNLPKGEKQEEEWLSKLYTSDTDIILAIETKEGILIGSMGIHHINWVNGTATTGAIIGEVENRGKGYGTDAKMTLLNYMFNTLNLRKICSEVIEYNTRSYNYSLGCGYREEGRKIKHIFRNGQYWDLIQLAVFKEDWLPIWAKYCETGKVK